MSFRKISQQVCLSKDQLLNLLLCRGTIKLFITQEKPITITRFRDINPLHITDGTETYGAELSGHSEGEEIVYIDGTAEITPRDNVTFNCKLNLQLHNRFE